MSEKNLEKRFDVFELTTHTHGAVYLRTSSAAIYRHYGRVQTSTSPLQTVPRSILCGFWFSSCHPSRERHAQCTLDLLLPSFNHIKVFQRKSRPELDVPWWLALVKPMLSNKKKHYTWCFEFYILRQAKFLGFCCARRRGIIAYISVRVDWLFSSFS